MRKGNCNSQTPKMPFSRSNNVQQGAERSAPKGAANGRHPPKKRGSHNYAKLRRKCGQLRPPGNGDCMRIPHKPKQTKKTKKGEEMPDNRLDLICPRCHSVPNIAEETPARSAMPKGGDIFDKRIWRVDDVAEFLGCSKGHIYNLASDEKIPKRKKNGLLVFVPEEIHNWILEGDQK